MPRATTSDLARIVARQKYGISTYIGAKGPRAIKTTVGHTGAIDNLEPDPEHAFQGEKKLQINSAGKVTVSIKFFRSRLADYSRAISEKAIIDALCYAGALRGDSEKEIRVIDLGQEKVADKSQERTEITLEYPEVDFDNLFLADGRTDGR